MDKINVKITFVSGNTTTVVCDGPDDVTGFDQNLSDQSPAGVFRNEDGSRQVINFRNVEMLVYTIPNPPADQTEAPAEQAPAPDLSTLTKADLTAALTDAGVDHDPKAPKAELVQLATDNAVTPPVTE